MDPSHSILVSKDAEDALEPAPAAGVRSQQRLAGMFEVDLHQDADAMGAASVGADGVDAVGIADHDFEGGGAVKEPQAGAAMPAAGLFESVQVIDAGRGGHEIHV